MTDNQLKSVAKALGTYAVVNSEGKLVNGFGIPVGSDYFLTPYSSRLIQDFLIAEGFNNIEYNDSHITDDPLLAIAEGEEWGVRLNEYNVQRGIVNRSVEGAGTTPQEALLDACVKYIEQKEGKDA